MAMAYPEIFTTKVHHFEGDAFLSLEVVHTTEDTFFVGGTKTGEIRICSLGNSGQSFETLRFGDGEETNVKVRSISWRGNRLVCTGSNKTLAIYDSTTLQQLFKFSDSLLTASPFNCRLYGTSWLFANMGKELRLFDVSNPQSVSTRAVFRTHEYKVTGLAITKGVKPLVVTTSWDHKVFLHDLETMTSCQVNCSYTTQDSASSIVVDAQERAQSRTPLVTEGRFPIPMRLTEISDNGDECAVAGYGKHVWMFRNLREMKPSQEYCILMPNTQYVYAIKICKASDSLIIGGAPNTLMIFSLVLGTKRCDLSRCYTSPVRCIKMLPDNKRFVTAGDDGHIRIHECTSESDRFTLATTSKVFKGLPDAIFLIIQSFLMHVRREDE